MTLSLSVKVNSSDRSFHIVIDTNVFVPSMVFGGKPRQVINLIADDVVTLVTAEALITEIRQVIVDKFPHFLQDLARVEKLLEQDAAWVKLGFKSVAVSRDPNDDKFIETALIGDCQYIVSGDNDLLDIKEYKGIKIVNQSDFLKQLN